jgi:CBS domain-containing protein
MTSEVIVRQIMRTIISIDSKARVKDAARLMIEKGIGSLVANRDGLPFGIVTERDLMEKIAAEGVDPNKMTVSEVMTAPLTTIDASASIVDAARRMVEKQVKRLIVTDQDKIVGIVTQTDLVSHMTDFQKLARMGMA